MPYKRGISRLTTWHSQSGLLLISFTWGMSYLVPKRDRIPFSEVFPHVLDKGPFPMWSWGLVLLVAAAAAFVAELIVNHRSDPPPAAWNLGWISHMILASAYVTLGVAALWQSLTEVTGSPTSFHFWGNIISAVSRTVLWGYIGWLHTTYAKLPRIALPTPDEGLEATLEGRR